MFFFRGFILILFLVTFLVMGSFQQSLRAGSNQEPTSYAKKVGGIIGDPSRKRGIELGYDAGPKAGREDKSLNKKLDPTARPEYQNPDSFYRYEYGSRAAFLSGFRAGFLKGYRSATGKIQTTNKVVKIEPNTQDSSITQVANVRTESGMEAQPADPTSDAL